MVASCSYSSSRAAAARHLVRLLLVGLLLAAGWGWATAAKNDTQTFRPGDELRRYRKVQALLKRLNKPALRTIQARACTSPPPPPPLLLPALLSSLFCACVDCVCIVCNDDTDSDLCSSVVGVSVFLQSPDGDLIDCVAAHLQPAFDHPRLRGQRPLADPPARPKGLHHRSRFPSNDTTADAGVQLWASSGEACPEGSVPIRRVTEKDVLRASSVRRFGRAPAGRVRRDSVSGGHEVRPIPLAVTTA